MCTEGFDMNNEEERRLEKRLHRRYVDGISSYLGIEDIPLGEERNFSLGFWEGLCHENGGNIS